jgi:hypothetical protein
MTFNLTREQLYDLVWSEPMQRLSKQIGISDVAMPSSAGKAASRCRSVAIAASFRHSDSEQSDFFEVRLRQFSAVTDLKKTAPDKSRKRPDLFRPRYFDVAGAAG